MHDQPIDSDIKQYKEIKKLRTDQGADYIKWSLLNYDYIISHYRLIAVGSSEQRELDADESSLEN